MTKQFATALKILLSILLAVGIMFWVFRKIDFDEFVAKAEAVNYFWVILPMIISLFGYVLRAYRWRLQLETVGYRPTLFRMFLAVMSGYLANMLVPRIVEITRCGALLRSDGVPLSTSFGTVITERIVDVLMLAIVCLLSVALEYETIVAFVNTTVDFSVNWELILILGAVAVILGSFVFFKFIYPSQTKVGSFSREMIAGLLSLKDVRVGAYILTTLAIWVTYFLMSYLIFFALQETENLSWQVGLSVLTAGTVAFILPVQSGFGSFHALVSAMLALYAVEQTTGVFFATLLHGSQLLAVLVYGLAALMFSVLLTRKNAD